MKRFLLLSIVTFGACVSMVLQPADIRLGEDACAHCRMTIVSAATAAQIVARGEEPVTFDEIGCLRDYLAKHPTAADAVVFVADHRTAEWIDARRAVFTHTSTSTPMSSGLVAHRDVASRDADAAALNGSPVAAVRILNLSEGIDLP